MGKIRLLRYYYTNHSDCACAQKKRDALGNIRTGGVRDYCPGAVHVALHHGYPKYQVNYLDALYPRLGCIHNAHSLLDIAASRSCVDAIADMDTVIFILGSQMLIIQALVPETPEKAYLQQFEFGHPVIHPSFLVDTQK